MLSVAAAAFDFERRAAVADGWREALAERGAAADFATALLDRDLAAVVLALLADEPPLASAVWAAERAEAVERPAFAAPVAVLAGLAVLPPAAGFTEAMVLLRPFAARFVLAGAARLRVRTSVADRDFDVLLLAALLRPFAGDAAFERLTFFLAAIRDHSSACPALETGRAAGPTGPFSGILTRPPCGHDGSAAPQPMSS